MSSVVSVCLNGILEMISSVVVFLYICRFCWMFVGMFGMVWVCWVGYVVGEGIFGLVDSIGMVGFLGFLEF